MRKSEKGKCDFTNISVVDPGFSSGGRRTHRGRQLSMRPRFEIVCAKTKRIETLIFERRKSIKGADLFFYRFTFGYVLVQHLPMSRVILSVDSFLLLTPEWLDPPYRSEVNLLPEVHHLHRHITEFYVKLVQI